MTFSLDAFISSLYTWQHSTRQHITAYRRCLFGPAAPSSCLPLEGEPRRVLIVVKGLLGDSILCTPVLMEARRLWPSAAITVLGRHPNCELLRGCPCVDSLYETVADPYTLRRRHDLDTLKAWLIREAFDVAIIALGDELAALLEQCGVPIRVGIRRTPLAPFLTHTYEIGSPATWGPDERLNGLRCLGLDARYVQPRLWVTDQSRQSARQKLRDLGVPEACRYAVIHPYSSRRLQSWPVHRAHELAAALLRDRGMTALLAGSTRQPVEPGSPIINATGLLNLPELLAILEQATLVVTTDSGPFHMAGALRRPTVGLLRAAAPRYASLYETSRVLLGTDPRCERRCAWDRCRSLPCRQMESLEVGRVLQEIESFVRRGVTDASIPDPIGSVETNAGHITSIPRSGCLM
jgi:ADP-heptose:LPS heptosyltransferase